MTDFTKLIKNDNNYKDIILRYYQKNFHVTPKYIKIMFSPQLKDTLQGIQSPTVRVGKWGNS